MTGELPHGFTCPDDPDVRAVFGCDGGEGERWHIGEETYEGCPLRAMTEDISETLSAWAVLSTHHSWPIAGGTDDQCAWFVTAAMVLESERGQYQQRLAERSRTR